MDMKIVADTNIPFLKGVFEPYGEVVYKEGRAIVREDCLDADVLIRGPAGGDPRTGDRYGDHRDGPCRPPLVPGKRHRGL